MKRFFIIAIVFLVINCSFANAEERAKNEETYNTAVFDGEVFNKEQIIKNFVNSVISAYIPSRYLPNASGLPFPEFLFSEFYELDRLTKQYPWFANFIYFQEGMPDYVVVNKWNSPIRISIGWPNNLEPFSVVPTENSPLGERYIYSENDNSEKYEKILSEEVARIASDLSDITGLDIQFLPRSAETLESYGNVRINFISPEYQKDKFFKTDHKKSRSISTPAWPKPLSIEHIQEWFLSAVHYTPYSDKQVEGYFIPNFKNEIQFAACAIHSGHEDMIMRALIRECIVRSLGFPNGQELTPNSTIGLWNDKDAWFVRNLKKPFPLSAPSTVTQIDKYFLTLLYANEIQAGMDPRELTRTLIELTQ